MKGIIGSLTATRYIVATIATETNTGFSHRYYNQHSLHDANGYKIRDIHHKCVGPYFDKESVYMSGSEIITALGDCDVGCTLRFTIVHGNDCDTKEVDLLRKEEDGWLILNEDVWMLYTWGVLK